MAALTVTDSPTARAILRKHQASASKAREVLDLVRGKSAVKAMEILSLTERDVALVVAKVLRSAVANAGNLYGIPPEELFISRAFADEGTTIKRFKPRARGRAGKILKRSCHITIEVERLPEEKLRIIREKTRNDVASRRSRRVRASRSSDVGAEAEAALKKGAAPVVEIAPIEETTIGATASETALTTTVVEEAPEVSTATEEVADEAPAAEDAVEASEEEKD